MKKARRVVIKLPRFPILYTAYYQVNKEKFIKLNNFSDEFNSYIRKMRKLEVNFYNNRNLDSGFGFIATKMFYKLLEKELNNDVVIKLTDDCLEF